MAFKVIRFAPIFLFISLSGFIEVRDQSPRSLYVERTTTSFPCDQWTIPEYTAARIISSPDIDGRLDEEVWKKAAKSTSFKDLIHGTDTHLDTRVAVLWDDQYLYVGYWVEEPNVKATLTQRDAPIYKDNDVELFVAGKDAYYELEINAYATIYEVLFIWQDAYQRQGYSSMPEFDRKNPLAKAFNGVGYKTHPRGPRIGFWNWDLQGLKHAVAIDGTIDDDQDADKGWTVELALPWSSLEVLAKGDGRSLPPKPGDVWKMDFSRFNIYKDTTPGANDSGGWAWSPHGVWDSHVPECFTSIRF